MRDVPPAAAAEPEPQPELPPAREPESFPLARRVEPSAVENPGGEPYPFDTIFSPLTSSVGAELRRIATQNPSLRDDRFLKVGDSISKTPKFLYCFSSGAPRFGDHAKLPQVVRRFQSAGFDSFSRESLSAENGWSAWQPLSGKEPPLHRELAEARGRYALVMFGTNDIETSRVSTFFHRLLAVVQTLSEQGVISILWTIPERHDKLESGAKVPVFNAAIRGVAQSQKLPLVDYHRALEPLPENGLSSDGIHPSVYKDQGVVRACDLDSAALGHGFNLRNLLALQVLDRVQAVVDGARAFEPSPPALLGSGSVEEPFEIRVPSVSSPGLVEHAEAIPTCLQKWEKHPNSRVASYRLKLEADGALEWLAIDSLRGRPLSFWVATADDPAHCVRGGRGFEHFRLDKGEYRIGVVSSGVPHVLAVVASRTR